MSKETLHIVKIGGKLINDTSVRSQFLDAFLSLSGPKILVHGGGRKTTELSALLGIEVRMIDGRRITNKETLDVAVMVYAGLINKSIVAEIYAKDSRAIGLSGADGDAVRADKRPVGEIDYGYVGDIIHVNESLLTGFLQEDYIPVICAISHDSKGQLLNTNADTIAAFIAMAFSDTFHVNLSYCFEFNGVLYDIETPELTMSSLSRQEVDDLMQNNTINKGMIPKISNGIKALEGGVHRVSICGIENLNSQDGATVLTL